MPFSVTLRIDPYWQTIVDEITLLIYVSFVSIFIGNSTTKHIVHTHSNKNSNRKRGTQPLILVRLMKSQWPPSAVLAVACGKCAFELWCFFGIFRNGILNIDHIQSDGE